ncbi:ABC transporter permease [Kosmotoga pacifica]|uniref:ABC transporter permease n=1 Tax=Kosmotoga pacifica TaxID=1330330 RepID=A0A0G2Z6Y1_9BACT|nr:ABC-2 family transporter protein [Kosmotoga pacifica]AKI97360.1 hypothetical protein IX53_05480 [Kosmotoga pacifica]
MEVFKALFVASLKKEIEYRFNFVFDTITSGLAVFSDFLIIAVIMLKFKDMAGWSLGEVALIYSIVEAGWGLFRTFGEGLHRFQELTLSGRFDILLIRPISTIMQVMLQRFQFRRLGVLAQAIAVGVFGASYTGLASPGFFMLYACLVVLSALLTFEISLMLAAIAFWTVRNEDIIVLGFYSMRTASSYPLTIYANFVKQALTFIIPLGTAAFYPVSYLTGKTNSILALLSPAITFVVFLPISIGFWKLGERHYSSTGT